MFADWRDDMVTMLADNDQDNMDLFIQTRKDTLPMKSRDKTFSKSMR